VVLIAFAAVVLSTLPYAIGFASQTSDVVYIGALNNSPDYAAYLASMQLGARGEWAFHFLFSSEPQQAVYTKLYYIFFGHLATWMGLSLVATFHLVRIFFGLTSCLAAFWLISCVFSSEKERLFAYGLAVFGSGIGWLLLILGRSIIRGSYPIDLWLSDAYLFMGMAANSHFAAITTFLAGMLASFLSFIKQPKAWKIFLTVCFSILIQLNTPYIPILVDMALLGCVSVVACERKSIPWRLIGLLIVIGLFQLPLLAYNAFIFSGDPLLRIFAAQNSNPSPPFFHYIFGFALFWPFVLLGLWGFLRRMRQSDRNSPSDQSGVSFAGLGAALAWITIALVLAYATTTLQRRFMHAFVLPLSILASYGYFHVFVPFTQRSRLPWLARRSASLAVLISLFASLSSIYVSLGYVLFLRQHPPSLFEAKTVVEAVSWLGDHAQAKDCVLSSEITGQLVASRAGLPVYLGHLYETINYTYKLAQVKDFYSGSFKPELLSPSGCRWVFLGPHEKDLGGGLNRDILDKLDPVFNNNEVTLFQVKP